MNSMLASAFKAGHISKEYLRQLASTLPDDS